MRRSTIVALLLVVGVLCMAPAALAKPSEQEGSEVTFVNGIRGFIADVYLDDRLILAGFAPERITEPMALPPGPHRIDLREPDAKATSEPVVTKQFDVPAGGRLTAIAHWAGVEDCIITVFDDAGDVVAAGSGKLIARHAAATGAVELALDDRTVDTLSPARQLAESVDPGTHTVAINDRGSNDTIVGSSQVPVTEGSARVVYLVGTAKDNSLGLLTQTIHGVGSNPDGVPTGNSGLAAPRWSMPLVPLAALATIATGLLAVLGRRRLTSRG